jgi:hypothetical protein
MEHAYRVAQAFMPQFKSPEEWFANVHLIVQKSQDDVVICSNARESRDAGVPDNLQVKLADLVKEHASKGEVNAYVAILQGQEWDLAVIPVENQETGPPA